MLGRMQFGNTWKKTAAKDQHRFRLNRTVDARRAISSHHRSALDEWAMPSVCRILGLADRSRSVNILELRAQMPRAGAIRGFGGIAADNDGCGSACVTTTGPVTGTGSQGNYAGSARKFVFTDT